MTTEHWSKDAWLDYLATRHLQPIQLGLARVHALAVALDLLHWPVPVITVAGTNGKGSTIVALESIYLAAGLRVAAYTSPHLLQFNERIRCNGAFIPDERLCAIFHELHKHQASAELTYFEVTTLAALVYFKAEQPDVLLLEVGLGGRLDATNIIDANCAIITTVDLDHQAWLGNTTEAIGYEKAGIFRAGQQVIYADTNPPNSVLTRARDLVVSWYGFESDYDYVASATELVVQLPGGKKVSVPRPAIHPKAAAAAIVASHCLQHLLPVSLADWSFALQRVNLSGRQQLLPGSVNTLLDVAHNPQAVRLLLAYLQAQLICGRVHAVFAALSDKDLPGLVTPLKALVSHWYLTNLSGPRAVTAGDLRAVLMQNGFDYAKITSCLDPVSAYDAAMEAAVPGDWVIVYGSFLTVGPVLARQRLRGGA